MAETPGATSAVSQAVRARTSAKSWLTRTERTLNELLGKPFSEVTLTEIKFGIEQYQKRLDNFDACQQKVEECELSEEQLEAEIEEAADFRDGKIKCLVKARELLDRLTRDNTEGGVSTGTPIDQDRSTTPPTPRQVSSRTEAKLPKIELPRFSGEVTQWQSFWDQFQAIIDGSHQSSVSKFSYLRSLLTGEALASIKGLALTSENYDTAKTILERRFGRKERIIFGHLQEMLSVNTISSATHESLWTLYDRIQTHVRSLENLDIGGDRYGVILTPLILHQLPPNIRLEWARIGEGHEGDLDFLLRFLYDEIRRRERSQAFSGLSSEPTKSASSGVGSERRNAPGRRPPRQTAAALLNTRGTTRCRVCDGPHYPDLCGQMKELCISDRRELLKRKGLCFRCLGPHLARNCEKKCFRCKGKHHMVLCEAEKRSVGGSGMSASSVEHDITPPVVNYSSTSDPDSKSKTTIMQVVKTEIEGVVVNVMFDSGSDRSFISARCVQKMKLKAVDCERIGFACFSEGKPSGKKKLRNVHELKFKGDSDNMTLRLLEIPVICTEMVRAPVPTEMLKEFEGIQFEEDFRSRRVVEVDILIGLDLYWDLIGTWHMRSKVGLVAQKTKFGWMLSGFWSGGEKSGITGTGCKNMITQTLRRTLTLFCHCEISENVIRQMWDLESIGVLGEEKNDMPTTAQEKVMETFKNGIKFDGKRYEVRLPWKNRTLLMANEDEARGRLDKLTRKLEKDPQLKDRYDSVLADMEKDGIIHEIPQDELETEQTVFYLPHRPVIREESLTTKVRPVFDASARAKNGVSLNDCMETGPNLIPDLIQMLLRFRRWKFGLTADITKAFLQIKLNREDQDVHRFLWNDNDQIRIMRFDRVIFGNACSPFLLNATLKYHLGKFGESRTVQELRENIYVDDWLTGADTEEELVEMMTEAKEILIKGGFPLTKWASNSCKARGATGKTFNVGLSTEHTSPKVLGISWNTEEDCFSFDTLEISGDVLLTKRKLLSTIARVFDPLGLLTPYTISLKILFQEVWRAGLEWDQTLPEDMQEQAGKWIYGLHEVRNWKLPRCLSTQAWSSIEMMELIAFSDASEKAYGCCIYLRVANKTSVESSLILSKARVAPLKKVTLPRLELLAAVLMARLVVFVKTALKLAPDVPYTCWTDSEIVLHWIQGEPHKWKQFVSNRVTEIQELTNPANWKHCPGKINPADLLTRGLKARELMNSLLWKNGPAWLKISSSQHLNGTKMDSKAEMIPEMEDEMVGSEVVMTTVAGEENAFVDYHRFGQFWKLLRVTAWVLRFIGNLRTADPQNFSREITPAEINQARIALLKCIQREHYGQEIQDLRDGRTVNKKSPISTLSPFLADDELIRVKGRLENATSLLYDERHPVVLPKGRFSFLLIRSQHLLMKHAGVETLITAMRNKYWIVGVRTLAKKVCKQCISCQRQDSRPQDQATAPLPRDRISKAPPFSVVGVDHAGPLYCTDTGEKKLYILMITCAMTRAVHLELVDSLSAEDCVLALRRFSARRGVPSVIYSDNAKTFKAVSHLIQSQMRNMTIIWKFNAPLAPWWGGWWERLIRSTKSGLRKSLGKRSVTRTQLETTIHEVEACINSRPLTYVSETKTPLTPSHFLIGRGTPMVSAEISDYCQDFASLSEREQLQKNSIDQFWTEWQNEYIRCLPPLRLKKPNEELKIGSTVLIRDEGKPRLQWPLAVVTKLYPGKDGLVRAVELRTGKGKLTRPIQKLHKLEVEEQVNEENESQGPSLGDSIDSGDATAESSGEKVSLSGRVIKRRAILDL